MSDQEKQPNEADLIASRPHNGVAKQDSQDTLTNKTEKPSQSDEDKKDEKKAGLGDFLRIFKYSDRLDKFLFITGIFCAIAGGTAVPLVALVIGSSTSSFSGYTSGQAGPQSFQTDVNGLVLYFVYIFIARFVLGYIGSLSMSIAAARTTRALRKAFLESLLRKSMSHFDTNGNGSAASQVTTNGYRINQGLAEKLYSLFNGLSFFFSAYIVALAVQWKLALITMCIIPIMMGVIGGCITFDKRIEDKIGPLYSRAGTLAQDAISSVKTIHAFGAQEKIVKLYDENLEKAHKEGEKKSVIFGVLFSIQTFLVMCSTALAFWQGYRMYLSGEIPDVGKVFTVVLAVTLGSTAIITVVFQIQPITNAASSATELFSIIDAPSLLDPLANTGQRPEKSAGDIEIRGLSFAYPSRPTAQVLQNLSISIPAGKTTALVGPSGCGKSTIVGLLERWYQPTSGQILLDGTELSDLNINWLRSNIRLVQQEPTLFTGTVYENVVNGLTESQNEFTEDTKMEMVQEACEAAGAHEFIEKLPSGYNTQLGEGARMLSGGQRQRLSIARSIIADPKILLFDEATSALDPRAEKVVQDALTRVSKNKTTLIIAHKLATVMAADNIAVMANGNVVEQGTHRQLIEHDGLYAAMVRAQDLGAQKSEGHESDTEDVDNIARPLESLQRTQSAAFSQTGNQEDEELTRGTLNYSLFKCIFIILKENSNLYGWFALLCTAYLVLAGTYPAQAILLSRLIGAFTLQPDEGQKQTNFYSLMFFVLAIGQLIGYFGIGYATNTVGQSLTHRYRHEMIQRVLNFDQDFFDCSVNSSGSLTSRLSSVPTALQDLLSANLGLMINISINILASSIIALAYGWKLGLALIFGGITIIVAGGYGRVRLDQKLEFATEKQYAASAGIASEAVSSIRTVSSLTLERSVMREYSAVLDSIVSKVIKNLVITLLPYSLSQSADFLVQALGFWYGSRLLASGEYSLSQFFVVFIAITFGGQNAAQLFMYSTSITKSRGSANYILWLRTVPSTINENEQNRNRGPPDANAAIELEKVEFRYRQRTAAKVLRDLSLTIKPGSYAAFVGPSGCGKSTIVSLLERFYDPSSGRVLLDDTDISTYSPAFYRQHMSLVQQEPPLYLGSVRDNIVIGLNREATEEEISGACRQANAHEFISSLPEGLNTFCGAKGLQFSGGQRQRIATARALIRKPRLLLLDEATSALDTQSEKIVQQALDEAASTRTTVAVAHRLSTIKHANVIFVIEDGRIAEQGTHEELQRLRGRYYAMCIAQSLDQAM